jgi:2,3-bisphosphoglycerate-independent phosphoglycerate mutase
MTPPRDAGDRVLGQVVLEAGEVAGAVRDDDRHGLIRVALVEDAQRIADRGAAHVREVEQHARLDHRLDRGLAEPAQADVARLAEHRAIQPVGHEGQGRRVGGHPPPEQVRERDVGDAAASELGDVLAHLGLARAQREAALDAVHERDLAAGAGGV